MSKTDFFFSLKQGNFISVVGTHPPSGDAIIRNEAFIRYNEREMCYADRSVMFCWRGDILHNDDANVTLQASLLSQDLKCVLSPPENVADSLQYRSHIP